MGFAIPLVEVNHAALLNERTVAVVNPVAGEGTGTSQLVLRRPVCTDRDGQCRPRDGGIDLEVRFASHASRRRHSGTPARDRKSTRLNSSHTVISYAVFCLKKKNKKP